MQLNFSLNHRFERVKGFGVTRESQGKGELEKEDNMKNCELDKKISLLFLRDMWKWIGIQED